MVLMVKTFSSSLREQRDDGPDDASIRDVAEILRNWGGKYMYIYLHDA